MSKFISIFAAGVALVILMDIATGQGPPQLQNYLAAVPIQFGLPPRAGIEPIAYKQAQQAPKILEQISAQEYEKNLKNMGVRESAGYEKNGLYDANNKENDQYQTTQAPSGGMFSSISNAWKTLTSLGRRDKRSVDGLGFSGPGFGSASLSDVPGAEWAQSNSQGYVYFKIPKNSICYN